MFLSLHIIIQGVVQGVNCRYQIKNYATENNLVGTVQNSAEFNQVEISIEGLEEKINKFITWLQTNPSYTRIDKIKILKKQKVDKLKYHNFQIIY